jgi:hypothetical protein
MTPYCGVSIPRVVTIINRSVGPRSVDLTPIAELKTSSGSLRSQDKRHGINFMYITGADAQIVTGER